MCRQRLDSRLSGRREKSKKWGTWIIPTTPHCPLVCKVLRPNTKRNARPGETAMLILTRRLRGNCGQRLRSHSSHLLPIDGCDGIAFPIPSLALSRSRKAHPRRLFVDRFQCSRQHPATNRGVLRTLAAVDQRHVDMRTQPRPSHGPSEQFHASSQPLWMVLDVAQVPQVSAGNLHVRA